MSRLIDTHCHLNFDAYESDLDEVLKRANDAGVDRIIIPAVDIASAKASLELANKHSGVYFAAGVHPNSTAEFTADELGIVRELVSDNKCVAIGEIGLDYYWDKSPKGAQRSAFIAQLELAKQVELPVIIHNREASEDVMDILENWTKDLPESLRKRPGVLHSFSASIKIAERALDAGFYLGFTGPITFKKADELRRIASQVPLDRILVETDGPFLTPAPYRGKRNEPSYIPYIAERLASLHQLTLEQIAAHTTQNAETLFALT